MLMYASFLFRPPQMLKKSDWRPFIWKNPRQLPIVTMCPNSGEAAHVRHADLWTEHCA
jgi:hypothetical protein